MSSPEQSTDTARQEQTDVTEALIRGAAEVMHRCAEKPPLFRGNTDARLNRDQIYRVIAADPCYVAMLNALPTESTLRSHYLAAGVGNETDPGEVYRR
ncbi:MAG: hypothetical protein PHO20_05440 [Candidatus Peribacteraceae bacterium]|nr:hypothetical protein [Candidatus Peribacteraceae bacterium]MDD5740178.1 hypothetical protein [Candidatus Peribacteraceae bacterium]